MKPASKKAKGARLEREVAAMIRHKGLDPDCSRMPLSGAFSHLPEDVFTRLPIHIECKNQEVIKLWNWWNILRDKTKFGKEPVLVISGNHRPIIAIVKIEYLLNLLKVEQDYLKEINGSG